MSDVEFVAEPPPAGETPAARRRREVAYALAARPRQWARVFTGPKGTAAGWRSALTLGIGAFHGTRYEAVERREPDGQVSVYARCVQPAETPSTQQKPTPDPSTIEGKTEPGRARGDDAGRAPHPPRRADRAV